MNRIALVIPLRNEIELTLQTIRSVVESRIGAAFDIVIVQDQGERNLSLVDFDLRQFNKQTIGRVEIIDVRLDGGHSRVRLLNHGFRCARHDVLIPVDPGVLLSQRFLALALHLGLNEPSRFKHQFFVAPCMTTGRKPWSRGDGTHLHFEPGAVASLIPILPKYQIETVRGYVEKPGQPNPDQDLYQRIIQCFQLEVQELAKQFLVCFLESETVRADSVRKVEDDNMQLAMPRAQVAANGFSSGDEQWGILREQYETSY